MAPAARPGTCDDDAVNVGAPELMIILFVLLVVVVPLVLVLWFATRATRRPLGPAAVMAVPGTATVVGPRPLSAAGRWYADPTGRFAQRWWDGGRWTADVVLANGQQSADPASLPDPPPPPPA